MGCNCKSKVNDSNSLITKDELNNKGKLLKIPTAILLTVLYIIISPLIIIYIWWVTMRYVFGYEVVIFSFLNKYKKRKDEEDVEVNDFNEDNYTLVDVDLVK